MRNREQKRKKNYNHYLTMHHISMSWWLDILDQKIMPIYLKIKLALLPLLKAKISREINWKEYELLVLNLKELKYMHFRKLYKQVLPFFRLDLTHSILLTTMKTSIIKGFIYFIGLVIMILFIPMKQTKNWKQHLRKVE